MSYESALEYIHAVRWQGHRPGLSRTRTLLAALGNPHKQLKFVHVAGTNGKGSTAAMLDSCLRAAGYHTGLFTSPFINRFNERIQVDGQPIGDEELEQLVERIRPAADAMTEVPTEFEVITALGMLYFAQKHCDIVVLEVGLGGELDSTNVIDPPECAVITALGMDHVKELGPTLADIARAKAGIIKPGSPVVSYGGAPEADAVIAAAAEAQGAPLTVVDFERLRVGEGSLEALHFDFDGLENLTLPLVGSYQPRNAAVAITALRVLRGRDWQIPDEAIRQGLANVRWPGRFEVLRADPVFLLDGSHNAHGMRATVESLKTRLPGQKFVFLLSIMADKDVDEMLDLLLPLADQFVTVTAHTPRALPAEELAGRIVRRNGRAEAAGSIPEGVCRAIALAGEGPVCALGTLYFSGEVRQAFKEVNRSE
ncbi:MAG TPA: bifunctional folylpolyglutamate synthase/dihydrofolate synthase [Candidatus Faecalibacterium intestinipullorum]|nr:bifunctional folylpolyglutamate synthase/dihydrofolate synthase [Candidatus Faecalibacterium intestinipullorum]